MRTQRLRCTPGYLWLAYNRVYKRTCNTREQSAYIRLSGNVNDLRVTVWRDRVMRHGVMSLGSANAGLVRYADSIPLTAAKYERPRKLNHSKPAAVHPGDAERRPRAINLLASCFNSAVDNRPRTDNEQLTIACHSPGNMSPGNLNPRR